eukprot:5279506-Amphidinium_carterae.1
MLVLRHWQPQWCNQCVRLAVRSDSVTALSVVAHMKAAATTALLAQEIALDFAQVAYQPVIFEHVPGSTQVVCDTLSRWSSESVLPDSLMNASFVQPCKRDLSFYRTLSVKTALHQGQQGF